jgi:hypothetical protein
MGERATLDLIEILEKTPADLERNSELDPDDLAIRRLRHSIVSIITELELIKSERRAA